MTTEAEAPAKPKTPRCPVCRGRGAIRDAMHNHPDIQIPEARRSSIVKRACGSVLALQGAGAGKPAETAARAPFNPPANGAHLRGVAGLAYLEEPAPNQHPCEYCGGARFVSFWGGLIACHRCHGSGLRP